MLDLPVTDLSLKQNEISPLSNTKLDSPNIQWRVANDQQFKKNGDEEREPFINSAIMSNEEKEKKKNVKIQFYDDNEGEGCSNNVVNQCNNENADWDKHRKIVITNKDNGQNQREGGENEAIINANERDDEQNFAEARRRQQQRVNIARLRQVLFIALCVLIVFSVIILLILML